MYPISGPGTSQFIVRGGGECLNQDRQLAVGSNTTHPRALVNTPPAHYRDHAQTASMSDCKYIHFWRPFFWPFCAAFFWAA